MDNQSEEQVITSQLEILLSLRDAHIEMGKEMITAYNGTIYHFDLFANAVFHRSIMLINGFIKLIPDNFISAAPLVRLQLDNYLRMSAVHRVDMPAHEFASAVINGKRIRDMQDKVTKRKLTDAELVEACNKDYPGLKDFYEKTSSYIHLSDTHIFHAIRSNIDTGTIQGSISLDERFVPDLMRIDAIKSMINITKLVLKFLSEWIFTKNNPEFVAAERRRRDEND